MAGVFTHVPSKHLKKGQILVDTTHSAADVTQAPLSHKTGFDAGHPALHGLVLFTQVPSLEQKRCLSGQMIG
jgi:hypothetical protein